MRRWTPTLGLGLFALAALVVYRPMKQTPSHPDSRPSGGLIAEVDPPVTGGVLQLATLLDQTVLLAGSGEDRYLVVTVTAPDQAATRREPVDLAIVVDTSGSMSGKGKISFARLAARELVSALGPDDRFSLVTFSNDARVLWSGQPSFAQGSVFAAIDGLVPEGGTNLNDGLQLGFRELRTGSRGQIRRLVLLSDGNANIGITDPRSLSAIVEQQTRSGISTSAIGLGLDYNEDLLAGMSDAGGGSYHFVDDPSRLADIFTDELHKATRVVARNVEVKVDAGDDTRIAQVYGWPGPSSSRQSTIFLGDIYAGQTRKIVMRIAPDVDGDEVDLARVRLTWTDVDADRELAQDSVVQARVSRDASLAANSRDREASIQAGRAQAAQAADDATRAYEKNDREGASRKISEATQLLRGLSSALNAPELLDEVSTYSESDRVFQAAEPASGEGMRQVKMQKEASREYAR